MKTLTLVRVLGLVTLLAILAGTPLYSQEQRPSSQDPATPSETQDPAAPPQTSMSQQSQDGQRSQIFVGEIAKVKGNLILKDHAGAYKLDNAERAKQFVGKRVKLTGTLDTATKTISVVSIEPFPS